MDQNPSRLHLDELPTELLQQIFEYQRDAQTLCSLALVNKTCSRSVLPILFRILTVKVENDEHLRHLVNTMPTTVLQNVRHLTITGILTAKDQPIPLSPEPHPPWTFPTIVRNSFNEATSEYSYRANIVRSFIPKLQKEGLGGNFKDDLWLPLAILIKEFTILSDLIWNSPDQLPPCILKAVENKTPRCRLLIKTFHMRCLNSYDDFSGFDPHELALLTSPCLNSISTSIWPGTAEPPRPDFTENAILDVLTNSPSK
jgi:hypothetical protein